MEEEEEGINLNSSSNSNSNRHRLSFKCRLRPASHRPIRSASWVSNSSNISSTSSTRGRGGHEEEGARQRWEARS